MFDSAMNQVDTVTLAPLAGEPTRVLVTLYGGDRGYVGLFRGIGGGQHLDIEVHHWFGEGEHYPNAEQAARGDPTRW